MKKMKTKIMLCICIIVFISVLVTGAAASLMNYRSTVDSLERTIMETTEVAASQVAAEIRSYVNLVKEFAYNSVLLEGKSDGERIAQLYSLKENNGFSAVRLVNVDGIDVETGEDISGQDYFQEIRSTLKAQVSEPLLTDHEEMLIYINVPMIKDGKFAGMIMGGLKATVLSDIAAGIQVGNGDCTILDQNGTVIAYTDFSQVEERYNSQELSKTDPSLKKFAALEAEMIQGKTGFGTYTYEGHREMMAYAPVPESNGWSISVAVLSSEFLSSTVQAIWFTIAIMVVTMIVALAAAGALSNGFSRPISASADRLALLAEGDLDGEVLQFAGKDETSLLARSLAETVRDLKEIITDITRRLGAMAEGDFTSHSELEYKGGFLPIRQAMDHIEESLNTTLKQIGTAADQVASGADQVASGAQELSQGATQQAAAVEELAATIGDISEKGVATAESAGQADRDVEAVSSQMAASDEKMKEMTRAMEEISEHSREIGNIIKAIEDIAFQTNILALNAAVEAARAGAAGKGFAVVADEVRNLANKSQEASQNTAALIEDTLSAVSKGGRIAEETAQYLRDSVEASRAVTLSIGQISDAAKDQAAAIGQINQGVDQISSVVQTNSATAQQSAAASEELSGQAELLKELLSQFRL